MKSSTVISAGYKTRHSPVQRSRWTWRSLIDLLFTDPLQAADPQVWHTCDQAGNIWWSAYDSANHRAIHKISESEMCKWLEQRHQANKAQSCGKF